MKNLLNFILILATAITLSGCLGDDSVNINDGDYQNDDTRPLGIIPPSREGVGVSFDIAEYMFSNRTLNGGIVKKRYTVTTQDPNGYFDGQKYILTYLIQGVKDDMGNIIIQVFENNKFVEKDTITQNSITVNSYDTNDILSATEHYPRFIRQNEDLLRNDRGACVLKQRIESFDFSQIIPVQAYPDMDNPPLVYGSVLHFYCGTTDGTTIDRYYANGWGTVGLITTTADGTVKYTIFDPNSYEEL